MLASSSTCPWPRKRLPLRCMTLTSWCYAEVTLAASAVDGSWPFKAMTAWGPHAVDIARAALRGLCEDWQEVITRIQLRGGISRIVGRAAKQRQFHDAFGRRRGK